jgi:hypothetical protein
VRRRESRAWRAGEQAHGVRGSLWAKVKDSPNTLQQLSFHADTGNGPNGDVPVKDTQAAPHCLVKGESQVGIF